MEKPIQGEEPQINWPTVEVGEHKLVVRWTFYCQWLLSKRGVSLANLQELLARKEPGMVDVVVECFAACVGENFVAKGIPVPTAEYWALQITANGGIPTWRRCSEAVFAAIALAPKPEPAGSPAPQPANKTAGATPQVQ